MKIKRNHPHYKIKIEPDDLTIQGKPFGDVPFTQKEFEFNYSKKVKEEDVPMAFVKIFGVHEDVVMEAWGD